MNLSLKATDPGFTKAFYTNMYGNLMMNIDIHGKGGVITSPDRNTPGGTYWFHQARDAALVMRTYMEINENKY